MKKIKSSLEEFLENYIKNKSITNSADSFDTYKRKNYSDYEGEYLRSMEKAYADSRKSSATYGKNAERIFASGLSGTGYSDRQGNIASRDYERRIGELLSQKSKTDEEARLGYANYLDNYGKKQEALAKSVRAELSKNRIIDKERAYEYALMSGLSESKAKEIASGMYSALRDGLVAELLEKVLTYRLDADGAVELARQYGLDDADTAYIKSEAERIFGKSYKDDGRLSYLEDLSSQTTSSFK